MSETTEMEMRCLDAAVMESHNAPRAANESSRDYLLRIIRTVMRAMHTPTKEMVAYTAPLAGNRKHSDDDRRLAHGAIFILNPTEQPENLPQAEMVVLDIIADWHAMIDSASPPQT